MQYIGGPILTLDTPMVVIRNRDLLEGMWESDVYSGIPPAADYIADPAKWPKVAFMLHAGEKLQARKQWTYRGVGVPLQPAYTTYVILTGEHKGAEIECIHLPWVKQSETR